MRIGDSFVRGGEGDILRSLVAIALLAIGVPIEVYFAAAFVAQTAGIELGNGCNAAAPLDQATPKSRGVVAK